jgi:hypothetical protein
VDHDDDGERPVAAGEEELAVLTRISPVPVERALDVGERSAV